MSDLVNILLVDDEPRNLNVLESFLKGPDYNLVRALSASQALLQLLEGEFAAIVLDIQMPETSGIELANLIKERKRTRDIPIIFLTAYYQEDKDVLQGYCTGAVDYLTKPINPQILKSKIDVFADLYRKTRALIATNAALEAEILQRQSAEAALHKANNELEERVSERTADLNRANQGLMEREAALRLSEAQANAASRAKDEFLAALSHELRTPLNPVLLLSSEAANDLTLPAQVREDFKTIAKNVMLEARLIEDLLDLTRISNGKLTLDREPFDVHVALRHAITLVQEDIDQKQIRLRLSCESSKSTVIGDEVRVEQAFWNVINNAVKFSPTQGEVSVATRGASSDGFIEIFVTDLGIGMTEDELSRIFNAFIQGDHVHKKGDRKFGGLGLGLAISQSMIMQHSGTISAASQGRNKGTTITIRLPLETSRNASPASAPTQQVGAAALGRPPQGKRLHALLVEDHPSTSEVLSSLLNDRQYDVTVSTSIAEARIAASRDHFDILISDLGLPDGDGCELMSELSDRDKDLVGIALSGYGMAEDKKRTKNAGFVSHLTKPIRAEELDRALTLVSSIRTNG